MTLQQGNVIPGITHGTSGTPDKIKTPRSLAGIEDISELAGAMQQNMESMVRQLNRILSRVSTVIDLDSGQVVGVIAKNTKKVSTSRGPKDIPAVSDITDHIGGEDVSTVDTAQIAADAIDGTKMADNAVNTEHITALAVGTSEIAADAVDGTKMADNAVANEHLGTGVVDTAELAADAVDGTKLVDNAIGNEHLGTGVVDTAELAADAVDGTKMANNAVGNEHLENNAVDTAELAASAVVVSKVSELGSNQSGTASDGGFVDVTTNGNFESQHDFATDDRWECFTHSSNRASYKNVSGGNSGFTISRSVIHTV